MYQFRRGDGVPGIVGTLDWAAVTLILVLGLNGLPFIGPFIAGGVVENGLTETAGIFGRLAGGGIAGEGIAGLAACSTMAFATATAAAGG